MKAKKILFVTRLILMLNWLASGAAMDPNHVDLEKYANWRQARMNERMIVQCDDRRKRQVVISNP